MTPAATTRSAGARATVAAVASAFSPFPQNARATDPLAWPGYPARRDRARSVTGETESVLAGEAEVAGRPVVLIAFEFAFMGGSLGEASGAVVCHALDHAAALRRPVISLVASGGCRMQEGMRALVQLQRIAGACQRLRAAEQAHVAVALGPTTGGPWAGLVAGADIVVALAGAQVAFGGARARTPIDDEDPAGFSAEGRTAGGFADHVCAPDELPGVLRTLVTLLDADPDDGATAPAELPAALGARDLPASGPEAVKRAKSPGRPRAHAYLDAHFETRFELRGDRVGGLDDGIVCGLALRRGRTVVFAGQTGTATRPAAYRTATRVLALADRLGLPVLTLIDTPGAANDAEAEREGIGTAIAGLFAQVAALRVPITSLVIGEGGSGGALALASPDDLWITPDGYFAVIGPAAATSILKLATEEEPQVADQLRLRPQDLVDLGVVRGIVPAERAHPRRTS